MQAVIFVGIQASGKTTFYRQRFVDTHIRLSLDMLRTRHRESVLLEACLRAKQPFVIDNTNVRIADRVRYIEAARRAGFRVAGYYFRTTVRDAIERNAKRPGKQAIPVKGIFGTYNRLQPPVREEGFHELYAVNLNANNDFIVEPWPPPAGTTATVPGDGPDGYE
jgi:predicted kinase